MRLSDIFYAIVFMSVVVGLAAGVLCLIDKRSLPKDASVEERKAFVSQRTERWQEGYRKAFAVMAALSIPANIAALITKAEPFFPCILWIVLASAYLLSPRNAWRRGKPD